MNTSSTPWRTPADEARALRIAAARARCVVRGVEIRQTEHGARVVGDVVCPDGWAAARMLLAAAADDARTASARDLALALRREAPDDEDFARAVFDFVRERVRFVREAGEVFTSPSYTLAAGAGDCDDHARLAYALLAAGGLPARLAFLLRPGAPGPSHVVAQAGIRGAWRWLETTIPARFGEHPYEAASRLGMQLARNDIATEVRTMNEKELPPVPSSFTGGSPEQVARDAEALRSLGYLCDGVSDDARAPAFRAGVLAFQRANGLAPDGLIGPKTRAAIGGSLPLDEFGMGYLGAVTPTPATAHITTAFLRGVADLARRFNGAGSTVKGENFLAVWLSESGLRNVQNRQGYPAYGLNQLFNAPPSLPGFANVGWRGTAEEYLALQLEEQLPYLERYYRNATGGNLALLRDDSSLYLVNFMPALVAHADDPFFALATRSPDDDGSDAWRSAHPGNIYAANRALDADNKGRIVVGDLKHAIGAAQRVAGPYWLEVRARYYAESGDAGGDGGGGGVIDWAGAAASAAVLVGSAFLAHWIIRT